MRLIRLRRLLQRDDRRGRRGLSGRGLASMGLVFVALLVASFLPGTPAGAIVARTSNARSISPPVSQGVLKITGAMADGGTVKAGGLSWTPSHLPSGDRVLSFQVAYDWEACAPQGGSCVTASDTTATPFAASRYIVGHTDVGNRLKLTETATEVVETDPATFSFSVVRASVSATTSATMRGFAGRAPMTEFVDGTPEQRTASTEEYFQVDPPHFDATDGTPRLSYRIDGKRWKTLSSTLRLFTGTLDVGSHRVTVRTSNAAGTTATSFHWQVVPMPAPVPCVSPPSGACWYPPHLDGTGHPMRWDWQIGRVTPLERMGAGAVDIYDIDGFLTTTAEVGQIHTSWQAATLPHPRAICYLDLAWEDYRPDGTATQYGGGFPADTLGKVYYGYPQERWVDFRQLDALKPMLDARISMCANKGFDAIELDDIDSFEPASTSGFNLTPGDAQNLLAWLDNEIHGADMTVLWKNTGILSWWGRNYSDGAVVEECYVYSECFSSQVA
ncbi:MAG: endo alpha-1,4 polygalactosaminidase, partial [Actinomycetota bacterium]